MIRYLLAAGVFISFSTSSIDQVIYQVGGVVDQARAAVDSGQVVSKEQFRPSELKAIGNYLETPKLHEVYPGLKRLSLLREIVSVP